MQVTSEDLESFRGQGYIEDTGLPGLMRHCQVRHIVSSFPKFLLWDTETALPQKASGIQIN